MNRQLAAVYNLRKGFRRKNYFFSNFLELNAVNNVSFKIFSSETLGLVGESGCGKTTLAKLLLNLLQPETGEFYYGLSNKEFSYIDSLYSSFKDEDIKNLGKLKKKYNLFLKSKKEGTPYRKKIQIVFQNPSLSLDPKIKIKNILREPLKIHGLKERDNILELEKFLDLVGLPPQILDRYPGNLSGGQQQRLSIARALILEPELLVADEPVSSLDISIQAQIINLLKKLRNELSLTMLFISHDLAVMRQLADRVAVMYQGEIIEIGKVDEVLNFPAHPYTKALISSAYHLSRGELFHEDSHSFEIDLEIENTRACNYIKFCKYSKEVCNHSNPKMYHIKDGHHAACHLINR